MSDFFKGIPQIKFEGADSTNDFAFKQYNPDEIVLGKRMEDHLRFGVAYWHSFAYEGGDPFGGGTFNRPWFDGGLDNAKLKADVAFEMFDILSAPYFCFHDLDVRPEGATFAENQRNLEEVVDYFAQKMETSNTKLLWGTANLFTHRRFMSGAATNPDPDVFAYSAATIKSCMDATIKLGGDNYVLWGGREGYETLLNTNLTREADQAARMLEMVVNYKHKMGWDGQILIEPKPQEPSKHQYDFDVATVYGFLKRYGLENEVKMNLEQGHAILAGHSFEHELALAGSLDMLGSIDMNRNDYQSGWDTDQFPNNVPETALAYYEVIKSGGFTKGGTNFDARIRRQSLDPEDLILSHVGGMDICARGFKAAAKMFDEGKLEAARSARYADWDTPANQEMLNDGTLEGIERRVLTQNINPEPRSGRQERLENLVNTYV
ncbi:MAG: xylose isomerase [Celeribacter sp.]|jgi:xylose isomerase